MNFKKNLIFQFYYQSNNTFNKKFCIIKKILKTIFFYQYIIHMIGIVIF